MNDQEHASRSSHHVESANVGGSSTLSDDDLYWFNEGTHRHLGEKLGAHVVSGGTSFSVWAPNAIAVSVMGDFNGWDPNDQPLAPRASSGIWEKRRIRSHTAPRCHRAPVR
jgi:1,4-alpha-glucan branching enzyme